MKKLSLASILAISTAILAVVFLPVQSQAATYQTGTILRCPPTWRVDYAASNGKKYNFPNSYTFISWSYTNSSITTVSCADFNNVPTGVEKVTLRPGSIVKFGNEPQIYAVAKGATLRHITTPALIRQIFGTRPRTVPLSLTDKAMYRIGTPINLPSDFNPATERANGGTVNDELIARGIIVTSQPQPPALSSNANVGFLTLRSPDNSFNVGLPTPAQQTNQTVANSVAQIQVEPLVYDSATVTVNGQPMPNTLPPNHFVTVPINVGANTITIVVTAQDGVTKKTYTVAVTRQAPPVVLSTDASLSALAENVVANLQPNFSPDVSNYTITVPNGTTNIAFTPTTRHVAATVTINGQTVASGTQSAVQALVVGPNITTIIVTAEDRNTRRVYYVTTTREAVSVVTPPTTTPSSGSSTLSTIITEQTFNAMFPNRSYFACNGSGIYTYQNFITAAQSYPQFASTGTDEVRKREVAAFLAQISHETTGGWATAPGGPYAWGLCFREEVGCESGQCAAYCDPFNTQYRCVAGKSYHGRGPMQLSWNYNYGPAGAAIGQNLLQNPDLVATDGVVAFKTAFWFWMTTQFPKPSAHDVMVGNWQPTQADRNLGRLPGFGMTTNIINGGLECQRNGAPDNREADRIGFFNAYTTRLGITMGDNTSCSRMAHY